MVTKREFNTAERRSADGEREGENEKRETERELGTDTRGGGEWSGVEWSGVVTVRETEREQLFWGKGG